jgi:hypothetical protein
LISDFVSPASTDTITWALAYAAAGMAVFPCRANKKPLIDGGFKNASSDAEMVGAWWTRWPHAEIGWAIPEGIIAVDIDQKGGRHGTRDFLNLTGVEADDFPAPCTSSPTGGRHLFFATDGKAFANGAKIDGLGIDIRAAGRGYVCLPGPNNGRRWIRTFGECNPPPAPGWIPKADDRPALRETKERLAPQFARHTLDASLRGIAKRVERAVEGERNSIVFWAACRLAELVRNNLLEEAWAAELLLIAARRAGLPDNEARRTIASGLKTA